MFSSLNDQSYLDQPYTWLIFSRNRIMVEKATQELPIGTYRDLFFLHNYEAEISHLRDFNGKSMPYLAIDLGAELPVAVDFEFVSLRQLMMTTAHEAFSVIGRAWQYVHFYRTHRYCGQCGSKVDKVSWETAVQCSKCEHRSYPRVSPCVIVAIYRHNQILLAQGSRHTATGMYSTIAGFVESGESLAQGVSREIREEVGVEVKDIEYFDSQPWPFPHALMVGFLAHWDCGDIRIDDHEIADAKWFDIDALPLIPPKFSIAGQLIAEVVKRCQ